uniref:Uncharacterized protein n=1 Tax=Arundo donax TaxID=35708 RepID=A0A0A9H011_ARUDO
MKKKGSRASCDLHHFMANNCTMLPAGKMPTNLHDSILITKIRRHNGEICGYTIFWGFR